MERVGSDDKVTLGDGSTLDVAGEGIVDKELLLEDRTRRSCAPRKVRGGYRNLKRGVLSKECALSVPKNLG